MAQEPGMAGRHANTCEPEERKGLSASTNTVDARARASEGSIESGEPSVENPSEMQHSCYSYRIYLLLHLTDSRANIAREEGEQTSLLTKTCRHLGWNLPKLPTLVPEPLAGFRAECFPRSPHPKSASLPRPYILAGLEPSVVNVAGVAIWAVALNPKSLQNPKTLHP